MHKFGLAKKNVLRLPFWSLTYRTEALVKTPSGKKKTATLSGDCLFLVDDTRLEFKI